VSPFLFEANPIHESDLKRLGHWYKVVILSDSEKMADFYACGGSGDSLYKEDSIVYEDAIPTKETCMTLDKLVEEENIPFPDFIKLDTQGSELDVLKGASKCLSHAKLILLECPIYPYNLKAPSMKEYIDFMLDNGLYPSQCTEIHNLNGVLIQIDILFIHQNLFDKVSNRSLSHLKRSKINRVG
jgi:FkbM family methyltransferase